MSHLLTHAFYLTLFLLTAGCTPGLSRLVNDSGQDSPDPDTDNPLDTGDSRPADKDVITVQSLSPTYGTAAGNTVVTVTGGPFDDSAVVTFADEAASIVNVNAGSITVRTPRIGSEAIVAVTVETDDGWGRKADAFTFFQDGTGTQGSVGVFRWMAYDGGFFAEYPEFVDYGYAHVTFIVPQDHDYANFFAPGTDQCALEYEGPSGSIYVYDLSVSSIRLESAGGTSLSLPWVDADLYFTDDDANEASFRRASSYDLQTVSSALLPGLAVEDFLHTPYEMDITSPAINGANIISLASSDLTFRWQVEGPGDFITLEFLLLNAAGDDVQYYVSCVAADDGAFSVPPSVWPAFPTGRGVWTYLTRWQSPGGILPHNNAYSGMMGAHTQMGYFGTK